jgi:membrane-associated protein
MFPDLDYEAIIAATSYAGIFGLMIANGLLSFPSSQILYIVVGYFVGTGSLALFPAVIAGAAGNTIGNVLLYEIVRQRGIRYIERWKIFRAEDIAKVESIFRHKGAWFLFVAKLLPAIKVFAPIPPAIGRMRRDLFIAIIALSSTIWAIGFITLGYVFGRSANLWRSYSIFLLVVAVLLVYFFWRYAQSSAIVREITDEERKEGHHEDTESADERHSSRVQ